MDPVHRYRPKRAAVVALAWLGVGCVSIRPPEHLSAVPAALGPTEAEAVARARRLLAEPDGRIHGGVAAARAVAGGAFELLPEAEAALVEAVRRTGGRDHPTWAYLAHVHGRLLNARASVFDTTRVEVHGRIYRALAAAATTPRDRTTYRALAELAAAQAELSRGRRLRALGRVRRVERDLEAYLADHPHDEDVRTLYANHMLTVAAVLPLGRRRRVRRAAKALAHQRRHFDHLSPRARNEAVAPGVRTVFAWWAAETAAAAGDVTEARAAYEHVIATVGPTPTVPQRQLAQLARDRLARGDVRSDVADLRPLGRPSCVACHARTTPIPQIAVPDAAGGWR
ncbi:MAG: hypothetical protein D6705_13550 [Deltaproteobacteria bacterium]|nr:MAG: hypothetical protein D6705_13550 [Deltaproteobacteria bacterium]